MVVSAQRSASASAQQQQQQEDAAPRQSIDNTVANVLAAWTPTTCSTQCPSSTVTMSVSATASAATSASSKMGLRDLLFRRGYEEALEGKSDADEELAKRIEKYGTICQLGIASLFWKGTTSVFKDMKSKEDSRLVYYITGFTICLLLMTMGTVASQFPDTSPFPSFTSGLGALVAILSMFGSYHLDLLEYFPSPWDCSASMISMALAFTLYWAYAVQDPWFVHLLAKLLDWLIPSVCFCGCSIWKCVWTNGVSRWPDGIKVWFEKQKARWPGSIKKKGSDESLLAKDLLN